MEERERKEDIEDRHCSLDDRGEAGVDPCLPPGEQPERRRRVQERDDEQPAPVLPRRGHRSPPTDRERNDQRERERAEAEPAEDQRRGSEMPVGDLDEHERRAPEERKRDEHDEVAAHH